MAGSVNKVILLGNLGQDPDVRTMQNGKKVCTFSIATSDSWKDKETGEKKEKTEWHRVVVFNEGLVGVIENYVKKGSKLYVEGELQIRKWQDQDGKDRYSTEVVLQGYNCNLTLLDSRSSGNQSLESQTEPTQSQSSNNNIESQVSDSDNLDEDIPF